jgi:bifunctional UDP-N-acetylglucosamine pyrophosphorylase/glucosamine-1-phosphate N-acetyltransferase
MLFYSLAAVQQLGFARVLVVVGHQAERIMEVFADAPVEWVLQAEQLGTGHAVQCSLPHLSGFTGSVLICCGDTPLLTAETLRVFVRGHVNGDVALSVLGMLLEQPGNYGRIIRDSQGAVSGIVEVKDASDQERDIQEVNSGIYCASVDLLRSVIPDIDNANAQGEYYLTDLVQKTIERGWKVQAVAAADPREVLGVNTKEELEAAEEVIAQRVEQPAADRP